MKTMALSEGVGLWPEACLVRMTEILPDPVLLTTDADFRIYRRHSRQVLPCLMP